MLFRIANLEDHKIIMAIAQKAYEKYIERMGKEPAPMRPVIQKEDVVLYMKTITSNCICNSS
jgi:hypothetical protein